MSIAMNSKVIRIKMYKFFYSEKFIAIIISIFFIINITSKVVGQSSDNLPCYSLAQKIGEPAILYEFNPNETDPTINRWSIIGSTNKFNIKSLAIDPQKSIIYAVDSGTLGKLNPITAAFETIGKIGFGYGDFDTIEFNNIHGLAFDLAENVLFATHKVPGFAPTSNDLLLKINPETGSIIRHTMLDSLGTTAVDYARIEKTNSWTIGALPILDINDIAFHPFSGQLYAFHKQGNPAVLSILNQIDGNIEQVINDVSELDVGGLGFDSFGDLYGTSMANFLNNKLSTYRKFDIFVGTSESLGPVDPDVGDEVSFICFDCLKESIEINDCKNFDLNINNFVSGGPHYYTKSAINTNAFIDNPTFFTATQEIICYPNFEIVITPEFAVDSVDFSINDQTIFSAEIGGCP